MTAAERAWVDDAQRIASSVASKRGLPIREPLRIRALERDDFVSAHRRGDAPRERLDRQRALWTALGFVPPSADPFALGRALNDEQVIGFYDSRARRLVLRRGTTDERNKINTIAHEVEHALQDQSFGLERAGVHNEDELLAFGALGEGDAVLTSLLFEIKLTPYLLKQRLARLAERVRALGTENLLREDPHGNALARAPLILREESAFRYMIGTAFVADLYRSGGFPLVDEAFRHPPASSEQVLHPEKYLEGQAPVPVSRPQAPPRHRVVAAGTLGELRTAVLLAQCLPAREARFHAEGWGGDAFAVLERDDGRPALLWSTAWDSLGQALRFESALRRLMGCWDREDRGRFRVLGTSYRIAREGNSIALAAGLPQPDLEAAANSLLHLVGAPPPDRPPIPGAQLAEVRGDGQLVGGRFVSERLALAAPIPPGFEARVATGKFELVIARRDPPRAGASIVFLPGSPAGQLLPNHAEGRSLTLPIGPAQEYVLREASAPQGRSLFSVPMCGGKIALFLLLQYEGDAARADLEGWVQSLTLTGPPPICRDFE
jgi:hypothetical protein